MINRFYISLLFVSCFEAFMNAQPQLRYQASLGGGAELNNRFAFGGDLKLRYFVTPRFFAEGRIFHSMFDGDTYRDHSDAMLSSGARFPHYSQSNLMTGYFFLNNVRSMEQTLDKPGKQIFTQLGFRLGYNYSQQSICDYSLAYMAVDPTPTGGEYSISGLMVHSGFAGLEFHRFHQKMRNTEISFISQHRIYADFMYGLHLNTSGIRIENGATYSAHDFGQVLGMKKPGGRVGYEFTQTFKNKLGFSIGLEFAYKPTIDYSPNRLLYVQRGGEGIHHAEFSLKAGLSFMHFRKQK